MREQIIGVIGGTGLYQMEGLENVEKVELETPFGAPSDAFLRGQLGGQKMVFLPRHGSNHGLLPHELNYRANVWGMKKLGVTQLISVSAVGSMREEIEPGHIVFVDQFIDRTRARPSTFFGDGVVVHVGFGDPICSSMRTHLQMVGEESGFRCHNGGTYVCIEGPQFSTRAESHLFRSWDVSVIGMTNLPEARLAREAEIAYATIALATDYDCWHEEEEAVSVEAVMAVLKANAAKAKELIRMYVEKLPQNLESEAWTATRLGLMTPKDAIPAERYTELAPILEPIFETRS
ncbi:MAG: S-methyl-5'-thioadenosine phosphorylase [Myxococcota bacterium]|nr:S-methyl-5'-thioadenosine phosphorylase [Myxococcota bacterium]